MNYNVSGSDIIIDNSLSLDKTFDCGQCFRWKKDELSRWHGVAFNKALTIYEKGSKIILEDTSEEDFLKIWAPYLDLDFDYDGLFSALSSDALMTDIMRESAAAAQESLHILRQEPFEALCSFIISQNNNIPRIKKIVDSLCTLFGEPVGEGEFSFPKCETLAELSPEDLAPIRSGFRAKYIIDAAQKVRDGIIPLFNAEGLSTEELRNLLMTIKGVGPKVSECTMLYGFHRLEAFPVDVWMKRAMSVIFPDKTPESFGKYAGIAQQYIFTYSRMHPELFENA